VALDSSNVGTPFALAAAILSSALFLLLPIRSISSYCIGECRDVSVVFADGREESLGAGEREERNTSI
jgi:hypothetical protein